MYDLNTPEQERTIWKDVCNNININVTSENELFYSTLLEKLRESKNLVKSIQEEVKVSVVFAVYSEVKRLRFEDFIKRKHEQLYNLFHGMRNIKWEIIIVDDGCFESSGEACNKQIRINRLNRVRVLHLRDFLEKLNISSTYESEKGGAIKAGLLNSVSKCVNHKHVVIYTDADCSTHLGQCGYFIHSIVKNENLCCIGCRRMEGSVTLRSKERMERGRQSTSAWKRLFPELNYLSDIQTGFKSFDSSIIEEIVLGTKNHKLAFDAELLLRANKIKKIDSIAIAWKDSEEFTTTSGNYLNIIQQYIEIKNENIY